MSTIKLILKKRVAPAIYAYSVPEYGIDGLSDRPLFDACRKLDRLGVDGEMVVYEFRAGAKNFTRRCSVSWGATHDCEADIFYRWQTIRPSVSAKREAPGAWDPSLSGRRA